MRKEQIDTLNYAEYLKAFSKYEATRVYQKGTKSLLKQFIDSFSGRPIDFLDIGAGFGFWEKMLITELGLSINYYYAIEPDHQHRERLMLTISQLNLTNLTVDERFFTKETDLERKFDLIFVSHMLYSIENPEDFLIRACFHLKPGGKLIILHQGKKGVKLCDYIKELVDFPMGRCKNHSLATDDFSSMLTRRNVKHAHHRAPDFYSDITEFIEKRSAEDAYDTVNCYILTSYEKLPVAIQENLYKFLKENSFLDENGRWLLPCDEGIIEVTN